MSQNKNRSTKSKTSALGIDQTMLNVIPITLQFSNKNIKWKEPNNITIKITDPKGKLLMSGRNAKLSIKRGIVIKDDILTLQLPKKELQWWRFIPFFRNREYTFSITAEAKGFKETEQKIVVSSNDLNGKNVSILMPPNPLEKKQEYVPISIQFLNVKPNSEIQPSKIAINIFDENGQLLTAGNTPISEDEFILTKNVLNLKILYSFLEELPANRYTFTIQAKVFNFSTTTKIIVVDNKQGHYIPIYMVEQPIRLNIGDIILTNPISGIISNITKIDYNSFLPEPVVLKNYKSGELKVLKTDLTFQESTVFQNIDEEPIGEEIKFKFITFDPRDEESKFNNFSNQSIVTNAINGDDDEILATPDKPIFFQTYSAFDIRVQVDEEQAKKFSLPANIKIELAEIGDVRTVSLWSIDEKTGKWTREATKEFNSSDKSEVEFDITHSGYYILANIVPACSTPLQISIANAASSPYRLRSYTIENNDSVISRNILSLIPREMTIIEATIPNVPHDPDNPLKLIIRKSTWINDDILFQQNLVINNCSPNTISVNSLPPQLGEACEQIEFKMACTSNCEIPNGIMLYTYTDAPPSRPLPAGFINQGLINLDMAGTQGGDFLNIGFSLDINKDVGFRLGIKDNTPMGDRFDDNPTLLVGIVDGTTVNIGRITLTNSYCTQRSSFDFTVIH